MKNYLECPLLYKISNILNKSTSTKKDIGFIMPTSWRSGNLFLACSWKPRSFVALCFSPRLEKISLSCTRSHEKSSISANVWIRRKTVGTYQVKNHIYLTEVRGQSQVLVTFCDTPDCASGSATKRISWSQARSQNFAQEGATGCFQLWDISNPILPMQRP